MPATLHSLRYTALSSKLLTAIICTLALCRFCDGSLTVKPSNIESLIGQRVQLHCSTSEPYYVLWDHASVRSSSRNYIFYSGVLILPYSQRFQLERDNATGAYNLVIPSVQKEDAGNYRCMDMAGHGEQAEAELIVLDSNPQCETDAIEFCEQTSQDFETSCTVRYRGNHAPEMECSSNGVMAPVPMVKKQAHDSVTYNQRLTAHWPIDDGHPIDCRTSISHVSSFVNSTVLYAFGSSETLTIDHREAVNCSANSSERCNYRWIHKDTGAVISSNRTLKTNEEGQYTCEATCMLRSQMCVVTSLVANLETQDFLSQKGGDGENSHMVPAVVAVVAVAGSLGILVVVLVTMYFRKKGLRKENKDCEEPKNSAPSSATSSQKTSSNDEQSKKLLNGNSHNAHDKSLEHNNKLNDTCTHTITFSS